MEQGTEPRFGPGSLLPDLALTGADGGPAVPLRRRGRDATVVALLHGEGCQACQAFFSDLAAHEGAVREWDGRTVIITTETPFATAHELRSAAPSFDFVADPEGKLSARTGIEPPAILIADQWGEIAAVEPAAAGHRLITPAEIVDWLRYLAIQCPECQGEAL